VAGMAADGIRQNSDDIDDLIFSDEDDKVSDR
jgi:hypothetical protein